MTSHFCLVEWRHLFYKWCEWGNTRPQSTKKVKVKNQEEAKGDNDEDGTLGVVASDFELVDANEESCNMSNISEQISRPLEL